MSEFMVKTVNMSKDFKITRAVDRVNIEIPKKSIYALLGPNGAGKTTSIRMILGLLKPSNGEIYVNGFNVSENPKSIRGQIGLLPQFSAAYYDLTPMQNIRFILELNNLSFEVVNSKMSKYFEKLDIKPDLLHKPFTKLSGGEQRAISFIMAVITDKEFLILDEPTSGLDISRAKYIRSIIKDLVEEEGKTILLSSHIVSDLEELAEYCGILKQGNLIFQGNKEEIIKTYSPEVNDFEDAIVNAFQSPIEAKGAIPEVL
ncbi:MAG: ABC transporter ATP-binding protein [Candidatus Heimdallarchaeota archaeon]|nr:ABC transporter ATP-binding protein [Candidatus Heimdallarchaeota archaeon]